MIVSVTRVLNEDDVIEAFVRHTATYVDRMMLLDNGSTDRTLEILQALRTEGYPIHVLQARSVHFVEVAYNTLLFHAAAQSFAPAWVLCLDADEFIDTRSLNGLLTTRLAAVPPEIACLKVPLVNYYAPVPAPDDLLVTRRFTLRDATDRGIPKCVIRGGIMDRQPTIDVGNHELWLGDAPAPSLVAADLTLAHYPSRHPLQWLTKATLGRLKVLAAGTTDTKRALNEHYTPVLDLLRDDPARLLTDPVFLTTTLPPFPLVEDPIAYAGLPLRYTRPSDPLLKALRCVAAGAEQLARHHGRLLDADPATRARADAWGMETEILF
jgi:Glycosyl transferase family 2